MKTITLQILGNKKIDLGKVFAQNFPSYTYINRGNTSVFASDKISLRTSSSMLNVFVLTTLDNRNYTLDFIAGGAADGVLLSLDYWKENSEMADFMEFVEEFCNEYNLTILRPGDSYY